MMRLPGLLVVLLILPTTVTGVERTLETPIAGGTSFPPTFQAIQDHVFTPSCALSFCHGAGMSAGLDLRAGTSYGMLVDVPSAERPDYDRIEPFEPDLSYVVCKIEESCSVRVGSRMPAGGFDPLAPEVIDVIRDWVLDGAPEFPDVSVEPASWGRVKAD